MNKKNIPGADDAFDVWQRNLMKKMVAGATAWLIPAATVTALQALQTAWTTAYAVAKSPDTRTSVAVGVKQRARKAYEAALRSLIRSYLTYNPLVSDDDRISLDIPVHKTTRTPIPPPTDAVALELRQLLGHRVEVNFSVVSLDPAEKEHREAKPYGVRGAEIRWMISDTPIVDTEDLTHSSFDTRTPFILEFEGDERGNILYVCARWENTTGQKGPWGEIVSAVIP
jgi:hypothetical protein